MTKSIKTAKDYAREFASKGGKARAKALTRERRSEIARLAGSHAWKNVKGKKG